MAVRRRRLAAGEAGGALGTAAERAMATSGGRVRGPRVKPGVSFDEARSQRDAEGWCCFDTSPFSLWSRRGPSAYPPNR